MDETIQQLADELGISYAAAERISYLPRHEQEMAILAEQMGTAEALRDTPGAKGRQAGRVYVAANPLEHLSTLVKRRQGNKEVARVNEERDAALTREEQARQAGGVAEIIARRQLIDSLRRPPPQSAAPAPQPSPPSPPPPAPGGTGGVGGAPAPQMPAQPPQAPVAPTAAALRGASPEPDPRTFLAPPRPQGAAAAPMQGPPEATWFDQNPARRAMRDRTMGLLEALRTGGGYMRPERWDRG